MDEEICGSGKPGRRGSSLRDTSTLSSPKSTERQRMRRIMAMAGMTALALLASTVLLRADDENDEDVGSAPVEQQLPRLAPRIEAAPGDEKKYRDFNEVTRGSETHEGLFTLHQKDDHLYAEIRQNQFDQPLLAPIMIARGMAMAGQPLNGDDEWVVLFKRVGDRVQLIRRNVHYKAPAGSPVERAVKQNYTDSILMALPIVSINNANNRSVVIDLADIFFTDFAELGFGWLDRSRTSWHKVKTFPNNIELEVEATFSGGNRRSMFGGDDGVVDRRGRTIVIHYSLATLPEGGYRPRYADDRVGHFLVALRRTSARTAPVNFVRRGRPLAAGEDGPEGQALAPQNAPQRVRREHGPPRVPAVRRGGAFSSGTRRSEGRHPQCQAVRWQEEGRDEFATRRISTIAPSMDHDQHDLCHVVPAGQST